eukprot:3732316-Amphidinium_carterae.1
MWPPDVCKCHAFPDVCKCHAFGCRSAQAWFEVGGTPCFGHEVKRTAATHAVGLEESGDLIEKKLKVTSVQEHLHAAVTASSCSNNCDT